MLQRLKYIIPDLTDPDQTGPVKNRQTLGRNREDKTEKLNYWTKDDPMNIWFGQCKKLKLEKKMHEH